VERVLHSIPTSEQRVLSIVVTYDIYVIYNFEKNGLSTVIYAEKVTCLSEIIYFFEITSYYYLVQTADNVDLVVNVSV